MGTVFLNFIIKEFVRRQPELGADYGIGITIPDYNPGITYAGIFTFGLIVTLFVYIFDNTKIARICEAIRDDEILAQCMGIYTLKYKVLMFAISAIITGFAGGLFLCLQQFVSPETTFDPIWSIQCLNMMLLGGPGTVFGPLLGAIFSKHLM
jgi:branched-chain amino acid transport system permease protein